MWVGSSHNSSLHSNGIVALSANVAKSHVLSTSGMLEGEYNSSIFWIMTSVAPLCSKLGGGGVGVTRDFTEAVLDAPISAHFSSLRFRAPAP